MLQPEDFERLEELIKKSFIFKFTRNLNKELKDRKINHLAISEGIGRNSNWYNRTYRNLEDMKITTFVKVIMGVNRIIEGNDRHEKLEIGSVLDKELYYMALVLIDLSTEGAEYMLTEDKIFRKFVLEEMKFYVESMKTLANVITEEDVESYERILFQLKKGDE